MKSRFAIFGLEPIDSPDPDDEKSGQPFLFRKYPKPFDSVSDAQTELEVIMNGKSIYNQFTFDKYAILELYSKKH